MVQQVQIAVCEGCLDGFFLVLSSHHRDPAFFCSVLHFLSYILDVLHIDAGIDGIRLK